MTSPPPKRGCLARLVSNCIFKKFKSKLKKLHKLAEYSVKETDLLNCAR
jgi:hypothetical protein